MTSHSNYWSKISTNYDEAVGESGDQSQNKIINPIVKRLLGDLSDKTILDAGCGNGYWTRKLAPQAKRVIGIDFTDRLIKKAIERGVPENASFIVGNLEQLDFEDRTFDIVLLSMVLMDIENLDAVVEELVRVSKPGGIFVASFLHPCFENPPNTQSIRDETGQKIGREVSNYFQTGLIQDSEHNYQHFHRTLADYFNAFSNCGLCIERVVEPNGSQLLETNQNDHHPYFMILKLVKS